MLCDICQTREAKIFYTEIVNGKKTEQHLCEQCATEHAAFPIADISKGNIQIGNILSGLLNRYIDEQEEEKGEDTVKRQEPSCPECGMSESDFLKYGRFGCPVCYSTFADIINKNFKATQGGVRHCGKEPSHTKIIDVKESVRIRGNNVLMGNGIEGKVSGKAQKVSGKEKSSETEETSVKKADECRPDEKEKAELINSRKAELKEALKVENYEEAARLRDEIRRLEGEPAGEKAEPVKKLSKESGSAAEKQAETAERLSKESGSAAEKQAKTAKKPSAGKAGKRNTEMRKKNEKKEE